MSWSMLDDGWHDHPKVLACSYAARGVWATSLSWSANKLTEGKLPRRLAAVMEFPEDAIAELVSVGLWDAVPDGWLIHDYLDYNDSKAEALKKRALSAARSKSWRERRRAKNSVTRDEPRDEQSDDTPASQHPVPVPVPVPSLPERINNPFSSEGVSRARDSLEHEIRFEFERRFVSAMAASPPHAALTKAAAQLVPWVEKTAALRKLSEHTLVTRMLDGFFANDNAKAHRYPTAYLLQNTLEYVDPPPLKAVVRAARAGPSRVPTAAEYAADLTEKAPWET